MQECTKDSQKVEGEEMKTLSIILIGIILICGGLMFYWEINAEATTINDTTSINTTQLQSEINILSENNVQLKDSISDLELQLQDRNNIIRSLKMFTNIQEIAQENADAHVWEYDKYMCCDFANDLADKLNAQGYHAEVKEGYWYNQNGSCSELNKERFKCKHCWVEILIPIEATSGTIIDLQTYAREYK